MHDQNGQTHRPARRPGQSVSARRRHAAASPVEALEGRKLFAISAPVLVAGVEPNINVTQLLENHHTPSIAVNPTNPANVFIASVADSRFTGPLDDRDVDGDEEPDPLPLFEDFINPDPDPTAVVPRGQRGILGALSFDAGQTYGLGALAIDGVSPSATFDEFGNLFLAYYRRGNQIILDPDFPDFVFVESSVELLMSTDGGQNFTSLASFPAPGFQGNILEEDEFTTSTATTQPTVVTGAGSVWISYESNNEVVAAGARVRGIGNVDEFTALQTALRSDEGRFADLAIGPNGQVMVSYQVQRFDQDAGFDPTDDFFGITTLNPDGTFTTNGPLGGGNAGIADVYVNVDPDGVGPLVFGKRYKATDTKVGIFDPVPAQSNRTIDAEVGIVWDRSGGPFNGRVWMVYTDESVDERRGNNTDIFVRFSDDDGETWSSRRNVIDEDLTQATQFFPRIALDQTTGNVAFSWYDTRVQNGLSQGDNDEVTYWMTVGTPTTAEAGIAFADNVRISNGISDAARSRNILEYGEYAGLAFNENVVYPAWADNSNSTGDNPSGGVNNALNLATLDIYASRVFVTAPSANPPEQAPVGPGSPLTPEFLGKDTIKNGKAYRFQVRFSSDAGLDLNTFGDDDLLVTGPNGYNLFADFLKAKRAKRGTIVTATYQAFAPGGKFDQGDNGLYSILVQGGAVSDLAGTTTADGLLDQFLVSSDLTPQSPALQAAPAAAALKSADKDDDLLSAVGL